MNLSQIRQEAWDVAREVGRSDLERLWTTTEMNRYINRIYRMIARETRCIRDATTTAVCRILVAPQQDLELYDQVANNFGYSATVRYMSCNFDTGTLTVTTNDTSELRSGMLLVSDSLTVGTTVSTVLNETTFQLSQLPLATGTDDVRYHIFVTPIAVPLHDSIVDIDECKWTDVAWRLTKVSVVKWQVNPWWEWVYGSMSTEYATDYQNNMLAMNFRTSNTDTLKLQVRRMPLLELSADTDVPELRLHYHDFILTGVLWQMYSKQDSQTFDANKSLDYKERFQRDLDEVKQQEYVLDQRLRPNFAMDAFR